jgi:hypothetical protein
MSSAKISKETGRTPEKVERRPVTDVIYEDDKVLITHVRFRPGDASPSVPRPTRISLALEGGTLTKVFPDGTKEAMTYETRQIRVNEPAPAFSPVNETGEEIVLYVVSVKEKNV